ncbi:MAG: serine hydrolase domain-containing protein [Thermomicrobiales bacterium]
MREVANLIERLERDIPQLIEQFDIPGMAVGVCDATQLLWTRGFGTTRRGGDHAVTPQTLFSIQSCSKVYTATVVLVAVQQGLVELDAPITTYLPGFSVQSRFEQQPEAKITLRHLLTHSAGFTHEAPVGSNYKVGKASFSAHCQSISATWLRFPVGHHQEYSNLGIDLAAYILQVARGLPFPRVVDRYLLQPLDMRRTTLDHNAISRDADRAVGHSKQLGKHLPERIPMVGAGGVYTTVEDACRYLQFQLAEGESLLDPGLLAEMSRLPGCDDGQISGYGAGLMVMRAGGALAHGHGGRGFGFLADLYWMPVEGFGVAVLTNSVDHPQGSLVKGVMKELSTSTFSAPSLRPPIQLKRDAIERLCGEYVGRGDTIAVLRMDGEGPSFWIDEEPKVIRFVDERAFMIGDEARETYRFLMDDTSDIPRYLQCVDNGGVWYRNDVPRLPADLPANVDDVWNRRYVVRSNGLPVQTIRLIRDNDITILDPQDSIPLRLREHRQGIYYSAMGEVLDLTDNPPAYANLALHPMAQ